MLNEKGFILSESILLLLVICTLVSMLMTSVSVFQKMQLSNHHQDEVKQIKDVYE